MQGPVPSWNLLEVHASGPDGTITNNIRGLNYSLSTKLIVEYSRPWIAYRFRSGSSPGERNISLLHSAAGTKARSPTYSIIADSPIEHKLFTSGQYRLTEEEDLGCGSLHTLYHVGRRWEYIKAHCTATMGTAAYKGNEERQ